MVALHTTSSRQPKRKAAVPPVSARAGGAQPGIIAEMASQVLPERSVDPEARWMMIAEAAYYCAERRGFAPGHDLDDWLEAEARVDEAIGK